MYTILIQHLENIFWIAGIMFISAGLGSLAISRIRTIFIDSIESIIFSTAVGYAIIGYGVFILGLCQLLYPSIIYSFTIICTILAIPGWYLLTKSKFIFPSVTKNHLAEYDKRNGLTVITIDRLSCLLLAACLTACMLLALTPEIGKDALVYHLGVPKLYLQFHGIHFIPGNIFSNYPLFTEMLYMWALSLKGELVAKGLNFVMVLLILLSMWEFQKRYFAENRSRWLSLLIFLSIPSVFQNAHMAYSDIALTFYVFVSIYAFLNWFNTKKTIWIVLCGVFCGVAMSTKYTGIYLLPLAFLGIFWACRKIRFSTKKTIQLFSLYLMFTLITGVPFYLKNLIMTGNPLYPLFFDLFGGRGWSAEQAHYYDTFIKSLGMGRALIDYLLLPWNLSFHARINSSSFDGLIGPLFLLVLPFAIGIRKVSIELKITLGYCLMFFFFWASSAQQVRYLLPILPFLAILTGFTYFYYFKNKVIFSLLSVLIAFGLSFNGYHIITDFHKIRPLDVLTGQESKEDLLARMVPPYEIIQYANSHLPKNSYILTIYTGNLGYLFDRPFYSDSMFESYTIESILDRSKTPRGVYNALKKRGFTHILYDVNYIFGNVGTFSEKNKRLFMAFQHQYLKLLKSNKGKYFLFEFRVQHPASIKNHLDPNIR